MIKYNYYQEIKYWTHHKIPLLVGNNKRVLEIGCSSGYLSKKMKENGCYVVGIEINQAAAQIAKNICDEVIVGDIEDDNMISMLDKKDKGFDVIVLGDVLEHCKEPSLVLKRLRKYLSDQGYLVVSVPNIANINVRLSLFFLGRFNYCKYGILDENHLRFFTLLSLRRCLINSGFHIEQLDVTPGIKLPFLGRYQIIIGLLYSISKVWKSLFAYQFVAKAIPLKTENSKGTK